MLDHHTSPSCFWAKQAQARSFFTRAPARSRWKRLFDFLILPRRMGQKMAVAKHGSEPAVLRADAPVHQLSNVGEETKLVLLRG